MSRSARALLPVTILVLGVPVAAGALVPRADADKPTTTVLRPADDSRRIVVKFREETGARLIAGHMVGTAVDSATLANALSAHRLKVTELHRLFQRSEGDLDAERTTAQSRSGRALADLNLYYALTVPPGVDAAALCDALNALPFVELAAPMPRPAPPPRDIEPPTPDFSAAQRYRDTAPVGVGAIQVAHLPGADGSGIALVDLEFSWVFDHEDLELGDINLDTATASNPFPDDGDHGTAVLGELVAGDNGYGVIGLARGVTLRVATTNTVEFGFDVGRAVNLAASVLTEGDVILIEQQICVCHRTCDVQTQDGLGPVEDFLPWYDAIATTTALGITVVEAAGNGNHSLDEATCGGHFNRSRRDSGAIIVGAGTSHSHARVPSSSWGGRIDVQGWGDAIMTSGYGDWFDPDDVRQRYTQDFGGTSGGSAMVAGVAAIVQGVYRASGLPPLSTAALRRLLVDTGTPQSEPARHIGPLPNLVQALAEFIPTVTPTTRPSATDTPRPTATPTPTPSRSPTSPPPTPTPSPTRARTVTRTPTRTRRPSPTRTPTPTSRERLIDTIIHAIFGGGSGGAVDPNGDGQVTAADVPCAGLGPRCLDRTAAR